MKKDDSEKIDLKHSRIGMGIHTILGIVVGWLSIQLSSMFGNILTIVIGIVIVILLGYVLELFMGKKGMKWWLTNGIIVYLFIWLVSWTFFFNLVI
jgi:hypothetical protein